MTVLAAVLVLAGVFFLAVSCLGIIRLPDFYSRIHAVGKSETLGAVLVLAGLAVYNGLAITSLKIIIILVFVLIANPTAAHLLGRAASRCQLQPWTRKDGKISAEHVCAANGVKAGEPAAAPDFGDRKHDLAA